jgi:hypothetical protein
MVKTHTSFRSYTYSHTPDGSNDYYLGTNGVSGFSITDFQGLTNITINILINFPLAISSATAQKIVIEIANSARTGLWIGNLGAFTSLLSNEYVGISSLVGGVAKASGANTVAETITAGWHMLTFATSGSTSSVSIDSSPPAIDIGGTGAVTTVSTGFTANKLSLMAATNGAAPYGCTWRELSIYSNAWLTADVQNLYRYYTKNQSISLANSKRSAARFAPYRSNLIDLYRANVVSTSLKAFKSSTHDLTLTNF